MADPIVISDEAVQDIQALLAHMEQAQFKEFLVNSIKANGATKLRITKEVIQNPDKTFRQSFTLWFDE
jgi:hypothetical protein